MKRRDPKGNQLLPRLHYKAGRYYYVKRNKWNPLSKSYHESLRQYALLESPRSGWSDLVDLAYQTYERKHKAGDLADNTYNQYMGLKPKLIYGLSLYEPHEITQGVLTQFVDQYESTPNIANRMLSILRHVCDKGVRSGAMDFNPATGIHRFREKKRDRYLTDSEYLRIWEHANPHTRLIMDMCYLTAQRIGDVLKIQQTDISKEGIAFCQQKTGKQMVVSMSPELERVILEARRLHKVVCKWLFHPANRQSKYAYASIRDNYRRAAEQAGVADTGLHDLRAKSLTDAKRAGLDPQKLAGHTSPAMTERYIRLRETDVVSGPSLTRFKE